MKLMLESMLLTLGVGFLRLRQIYTRLRKKREWGTKLFIMRLNRKENDSYEENN